MDTLHDGCSRTSTVLRQHGDMWGISLDVLKDNDHVTRMTLLRVDDGPVFRGGGRRGDVVSRMNGISVLGMPIRLARALVRREIGQHPMTSSLVIVLSAASEITPLLRQ